LAILVGIDELNWYGPSTKPLVIPIRRLFDAHCVAEYSANFADVCFTLRIGDAKDGLGRVSAHELSSSVGIDVMLTFDPNEYPDGYAEKILLWLRGAVDKLAEYMADSDHVFNDNQLRVECEAALTEYERGLPT
jgi:hypothetical protein